MQDCGSNQQLKAQNLPSLHAATYKKKKLCVLNSTWPRAHTCICSALGSFSLWPACYRVCACVLASSHSEHASTDLFPL